MSIDHGRTHRPRSGASLPLVLIATAASALAILAARTVRAATDLEPAPELVAAAPAAKSATVLPGVQGLATMPDAGPPLATAVTPQAAGSGGLGTVFRTGRGGSR